MKIGFAQQCITPSFPVPLAGFSKKRTAWDARDDLFVKIVVYQRETGYYGIFAYDLIAVDEVIVNQMKAGIKRLHLNQANFLFTATHTHSGPGGVLKTGEGLLKPAAGIFLETDPSLAAFIVQKSLQALQEALEACRETKVACARDTLAHVGDNRNSRNLKGDQEIAAAFLTQEDGKKAVILNFACHPTVMGSGNEKISADFPGAVAACMQKHGYGMCMYLNGSCGDISTRFSRKSHSADELLRYGRMFEEKLLFLERSAKPVTVCCFDVFHTACRLGIKQAECIEAAQKKFMACEKKLKEAKRDGVCGSQLRVLESYLEGAQANLSLSQEPYTMEDCDVPVMLITINGHVFVCVPGELFSELSNPIKGRRMHFIGYANGYMGYFADKRAYGNLYYEALSSPFLKGEGEKLMQFVLQAAEKRLGKER